MPLATIHLVSLVSSTSILKFLDSLKSTSLQPLVISKVIRWIIEPEKIDAKILLQPPKPWDLLIIALGTDPFPTSLESQIHTHWTATAGVPSRITNDFATTNSRLLHPDPKSVPAISQNLANPHLNATSSQHLELSPSLQAWIQSFSQTRPGSSGVSMLNLLSFNEGMKPSYLKYGAAFSQSIGIKRGGVAKLVGNITAQRPESETGGAGSWNEFALAHYPSISHFADMLASSDYQDVNLKFRVPALNDTLILCTSEIAIEDLLKEAGRANKL
ncbi:hypothetical protein PV10_02110 [Exophiala mesophila]|uniref:DUF1330 domain-containing protein n=1 Tax=Exophiala mesophila TaxID=212818 RepID=A0A0D1Y1B4_EXOME|nr:uncharacterized protein PV10_02110 [Exophiala mesophila]KIV94336.1 hypothetical protein PV10_02110 [Exophiala mesophila]